MEDEIRTLVLIYRTYRSKAAQNKIELPLSPTKYELIIHRLEKNSGK